MQGCERWSGVQSKVFDGLSHLGMVSDDEVIDEVVSLVYGANQELVDLNKWWNV